MVAEHQHCPFVFSHQGIEVRCEYKAQDGKWYAYFDLPKRDGGVQRAIHTHLPRSPGLQTREAASADALRQVAISEIESYLAGG
jgi:hypothetical protein